MTLLHVLGSDSMGGCERLSIDLAAHYAQIYRDMDQTALFFGQAGSGPAWREFEALGIDPYSIPFQGRVIPFVRAVRGLCRRRRIRIVLTHGFGMHLLIALGARLGGARKVLALVGNPPSTDPAILRRATLRAQLARPLVNREIACSNYVKQQMIREYDLPSRRVAVVHNWVRTDEIARRCEAARSARRSSMNSVGGCGPVMIMVARLDPIKDHATVIRAAAALRPTLPSIKLRLVGDGPIRSKLESLVSELGLIDAVEFLGARDDIPEQLGLADVFVYGTTADEGFGIVLAEAMAAGVPIVCTDIGPCEEVLDGGRAGVLVPPRDPNFLANAVAELLGSPETASKLAAYGQEFARRHYTVAAAARALDKYALIPDTVKSYSAEESQRPENS